VKQNIASTKTMTWIKRITRPITAQVERAGELNNFGRVYKSSNRTIGFYNETDKAARERPGLLAPELIHVHHQIQSSPLPQNQTRNHEESTVVAVGQETHSSAGMVFRAISQTPVASTRRQEETTRTQPSEQTLTEASSEPEPETKSQVVDVKEVADRVYRLMRHELIVERERATRSRDRLGG